MTMLFCFTMCISPPWIFTCAVLSDVSDMENLLRALLHSGGSFGCSMSPTFLEGVSKLSVDFYQYPPRDLAWLYPLISLGVSALVAGSSTIWPLVWRRLCGIFLVPQLPVMTRPQKCLEGLFRSVPVNLLPRFFFPRITTEKSSTGCLPSLRQDFWFVYLSSCSVRK